MSTADAARPAFNTFSLLVNSFMEEARARIAVIPTRKASLRDAEFVTGMDLNALARSLE
jgi:hypothetical protein